MEAVNWAELGALGVVLGGVVMPIIKDYIIPSAKAERDRRMAQEERQIDAIEGLKAAITQMQVTISAFDQRLAAVERDQERLIDRLPIKLQAERSR